MAPAPRVRAFCEIVKLALPDLKVFVDAYSFWYETSRNADDEFQFLTRCLAGELDAAFDDADLLGPCGRIKTMLTPVYLKLLAWRRESERTAPARPPRPPRPPLAPKNDSGRANAAAVAAVSPSQPLRPATSCVDFCLTRE